MPRKKISESSALAKINSEIIQVETIRKPRKSRKSKQVKKQEVDINVYFELGENVCDLIFDVADLLIRRNNS